MNDDSCTQTFYIWCYWLATVRSKDKLLRYMRKFVDAFFLKMLYSRVIDFSNYIRIYINSSPIMFYIQGVISCVFFIFAAYLTKGNKVYCSRSRYPPIIKVWST